MTIYLLCRKHGALDPADIYTYPSGHTKCRICAREHMSRHRAKKRAKVARMAGRRRPDGGWFCGCGKPAIGRGTSCSACMTASNYPVPKARLRPLIEAELVTMDGERDAVLVLAERCGVSDSTIYEILKERKGSGMRFDFGDRILTGLGLTYLWYVPADQGGFADIYGVEDEENAAPSELERAA